MAKSEQQLIARQLRSAGRSIISIARELDVSKSSASIWCRDIVLTESQKECLNQNSAHGRYSGSLKGAQANREKKERIIELYKKAGLDDIRTLSERDLFIIGTALYWAEGSKDRFTFVNSDPTMILLICRWLREIMGINKVSLMPRIFINETHEPRAEIVLKFWSELLKLPPEQFRKTVFIKHNQKKLYENHNLYYGTLHLGVRNSKALKYRISGLIEAIGAQAKPV